MKGRTQKYYDANPEAKAKKAKYDSEFQKKRDQVKKRVEANKFNRENSASVKGDGMDASHKGGRIVLEKAKANRARGGAKKK
jgi:hypothetical protein